MNLAVGLRSRRLTLSTRSGERWVECFPRAKAPLLGGWGQDKVTIPWSCNNPDRGGLLLLAFKRSQPYSQSARQSAHLERHLTATLNSGQLLFESASDGYCARLFWSASKQTASAQLDLGFSV